MIVATFSGHDRWLSHLVRGRLEDGRNNQAFPSHTHLHRNGGLVGPSQAQSTRMEEHKLLAFEHRHNCLQDYTLKPDINSG